MLIENMLTVSGSLHLMDAEEDAPLVKVQFCNELATISDSQKLLIGEAILAVLGATSLSVAMGDTIDNKEKLARLILATTKVADDDTPTVPAGLAERTAALAADLPVVRRILTPAYTVRPSLYAQATNMAIRCTSRIGMRLANDNDDDAAFEKAMTAFRQHFGPRLLEVSENVCAYHQDFTIYLRA